MTDSKTSRADRIRSASQRRRKKQKAETRQAIIDAATTLFLDQGYSGFSLRQVAEQIGYSPGTIYLYFDNKDDLLFTIADEGFNRFGQMLTDAVNSTDDARLQIKHLGEAYIRFGLENPVNYRLMFMERTDFMLREKESGKTWSETFLILYHAVQRAFENGQITQGNPDVMSDSIWAMLHGAVALALQMHDFHDKRADVMLDMVQGLIQKSVFESDVSD